MRMQRVRVWHMRMGMPGGRVPVPLAVAAPRHRLVVVQVVPIVMAVGVFMLQCPMVMRMFVRFHQVQHHTRQHQRAPDGHHAAC